MDYEDNGPTTVSGYGTVLIEQTLGLFINALGTLPGATILVILIFMLDTLVALPDAKLYFVIGIFLLMVPFYTLSLMFPPEKITEARESDTEFDQHGGGSSIAGKWWRSGRGKSVGGGPTIEAANVLKNLAPFFRNTRASFYNFFAGYLLGYWANLNITKKRSNAPILMCYYLAIAFFAFVFSVFYVQSCSWKAGLASSVFGIIGGIIWSSVVADKVRMEPLTSLTSSAAQSSSGNLQTTCGAPGENAMVCDAFLK